MELFTLLAVMYLATVAVGIVLERLRVPWIFGALLFGVALSALGIKMKNGNMEYLEPLGELGMLFLLFIIGFEISIHELRRQSKYVISLTTFIILFEALMGGLTLHYIFHYPIKVSFIAALSLATIGEAILVPILDEFGIARTRIGEVIISVGTLDDIFEVVAIFFAGLFVSATSYQTLERSAIALGVLLISTAVLLKVRKLIKEEIRHAKLKYFLLGGCLFVFFSFVSIAKWGGMDAVGAILAGVVAGNLLPSGLKRHIESEVRVLAYGFFATIFFFVVGLSMDVHEILAYPVLTLAIFAVATASKYVAVWVGGLGRMNVRERLVTATGLSVRFSTSLVVAKILLNNKLIDISLYSAFVAASSISTILVPFVFAWMLKRWRETFV